MTEGPSAAPVSSFLRADPWMGDDPERVRRGILVNLIWLAGLQRRMLAWPPAYDSTSPPLGVFLVIALITEITAVILFKYLLPTPALRVQRWPDSVVASASSDHSTLFFIVAKALRRLQSSRARGLKVLRGDSGGDGRGVGALDVCRVGDPAGGPKSGIVQDIGIDVNQSLADAVFD